MCGVMLKHHGYNVTILEQEISSVRKGYDAGITIGPAVQDWLRKHDRVKREMTITCPPGVKININGEPKAQRGQTMVNTSWGLLVSILRANFDGLISAAVPVAPKPWVNDGNANFRSGTRVTGVESVNGKIDVHFEEFDTGKAQKMSASLAIVADGSNSTIRKVLLPDVKRGYLGYMCWRGTVPEDQIDKKWNKLYSEKATFHLMSKTYLLKYVHTLL
jgi:2-polyprenyl-6-methoxyphenol hydroxylase-like FAD-dependent oxidoreductase